MTQANTTNVQAPAEGVDRYAEFCDLVLERTREFCPHAESAQESLLDGAAGRAAESLIDKATRARDGIFFSGHHLAEKVVRHLESRISEGSSVYDPTCGAGDLLIQAAKLLPLSESVHMTLGQWGKHLLGTDLHRVFVETAKRRLTLLALYRHRNESPGTDLSFGTNDYFPGIRVGDFLCSESMLPEACDFLMNPPFVSASGPDWVTWSSGRLQMAGAFFESAVKKISPERHIVAILPDVLRSGTRYARWREMVVRAGDVRAVEAYGKFDSATDVDVFVLHFTKRKSPRRDATWPTGVVNDADTSVPLSHLAQVTVGAVVPHRHPNRGPWCGYLEVSNAPAFGETRVTRKRRFTGTVVQPPFLVVRRTSNPSDKDRLITTVIMGTEPIAVENHLIVVKPFSVSVEECRRIASELQAPSARQWLDTKIRCRHLTTAAMKDLPVKKGKA